MHSVLASTFLNADQLVPILPKVCSIGVCSSGVLLAWEIVGMLLLDMLSPVDVMCGILSMFHPGWVWWLPWVLLHGLLVVILYRPTMLFFWLVWQCCVVSTGISFLCLVLALVLWWDQWSTCLVGQYWPWASETVYMLVKYYICMSCGSWWKLAECCSIPNCLPGVWVPKFWWNIHLTNSINLSNTIFNKLPRTSEGTIVYCLHKFSNIFFSACHLNSMAALSISSYST